MRYDRIFNGNIYEPTFIECKDYCLIHNINTDVLVHIYNKYNKLPKRIVGKIFYYQSILIDFEKNIIKNLVVSNRNITFAEVNITIDNISLRFN